MRIASSELPLWLEKGATIVAPTSLLARTAQEEFTRRQVRKGIETWPRPPILGFDAWLEHCWQSARYGSLDLPALLSSAQEQALWHGIIEQENPHLFDVSATVRLSRSAERLLADWHIPTEGEVWNEPADAAEFQKWSRLVRRKCHANGWITRADLTRKLPGLIESETCQPGLTVFVGFDPMPPALDRIQDVMGALSVLLPFKPNGVPKKAAAKQCPDFAAEIEFAARRLRLLFEDDPNRSLALFVPELSAHHSLIERTLRSVFFPSASSQLVYTHADNMFYLQSSSLLVQHPLVSSALLLLNLASARIHHADAGAILRSPFIAGAAAEKNLRALADIELRRRRELDVSLADIEHASRACRALSQSWRKLEALVRKTPPVQELAKWSEFITDLLASMGWPGDVELNEREEKTAERWNNSLSVLAGLGLVSQPVTLQAALAHLRRLLSNPLEVGDASSPIQVLDATQARGIEFDASVAIGLSEETWPVPLRISPLVPLRLQRNHHVPGSAPQSAREERTRSTQALFQSAREVHATFSGRIARIAEGFLAAKSKIPPVWAGQVAMESFTPEPLGEILDGQAPRFVAKGEVRGGTGIIKAQSQCPFRAFAEYRLNARSPEDASFGFDARDRGGFVHKALEIVWARLESSEKLRATSREDLRDLVNDAIAEAVQTKETGALHQLSITAERIRLEELILEWLDAERARTDPFTVEKVEQAQKYEVPGLSLQLRVDRIDRLRNGNLILIDYKSGAQTRNKLLGARPPEPQLLVYAASVGAGVDGVLFGQLKPREVKAVGYSKRKQFKMQTAEEKKDWDTYIATSRVNVERLANEFVQGVAEVDPIKDACQYCVSKPFCRVKERGSIGEEEE